MSFAKTDLKNHSNIMTEPGVWSLLNRVSNFLTEHNIESYVVGGFVRDLLLGRDTTDIDIAVASDALEIASEMATALGGKYVPLDRINRIGRVVLVDKEASSTQIQWVLDFSTFTGSIEQDLAQRDFTINAMAMEMRRIVAHSYSQPSPTSKERGEAARRLSGIIDPFNGEDDLQRGMIRAVTESAFASDAVRLLRAVRLATELSFSIDEKTEALIRRYAHLIADVAGERVREELLRLLDTRQDERLFPYLDELGLLTAVFPELAETKGIEQPKEHSWNVFEHSLKTVIAVDFLLRQGTWGYAAEEALTAVPWSAVLAEHFDRGVSSGSTRGLLLKLAALLHDVAKPQTKAIDAGGRMRFLRHANEGAIIAANILERLRFSAKEVKLVETAVKHHLRPSQMSQVGHPSRRAIYRYFRDIGEAGIDILFLNLADHLATRGPHLSLAHW